jgi:hypothetical protein
VPLHLLIGARILIGPRIGTSSEGSPFGALNVSILRYLCGQKMPANGPNMPTHGLYPIATRHASPQGLDHSARHFSAGRSFFQAMRPARLLLERRSTGPGAKLTERRSSDNPGTMSLGWGQSCQQFISGSRNSIVVPVMVPPVPMTPVRMGIIGVTARPPIVPGRIITRTDVIMWSIEHRYRNREPNEKSRLR